MLPGLLSCAAPSWGDGAGTGPALVGGGDGLKLVTGKVIGVPNPAKGGSTYCTAVDFGVRSGFETTGRGAPAHQRPEKTDDAFCQSPSRLSLHL